MESKSKFIKIISIVIIITFSIFILSCNSAKTGSGTEQVKTPKVELTEFLKKTFPITTSPEIKVENSKEGKGYDIYVDYTPTNLFKYKSEESDKKAFSREVYTKVNIIYKNKVQVNKIVINARESNQKMVADPKGKLHIISVKEGSTLREIATFEITKEEYDSYVKEFEDPEYKIKDHIKFHPFFLVELKLKTSSVPIKNLIVTENILNLTEENKVLYARYLKSAYPENQTSVLVTEIIFEPSNINTFGKESDAKIKFEENFAKIIVSTFEADNDTDIINVTARSSIVDKRDLKNPTDRIVNYMTNRKEFNDIMKDYDNYRSKIYDEMNYSPIYLLDLVALSDVSSIDYNKSNTVVYMDYSEDYKKVDITVDNLEKDSVNVMKNIFLYLDTDKVKLVFKAKIPDDGSLLATKGHKLLNDSLVIETTKTTFNSIKTDKIENYQVIYNMNYKYNKDLEILSLKNGLALDNKYYRSVVITGSKAVVEYDLCGVDFEGTNATKVDKTLTKFQSSAKKVLYENFPPYLDEIQITFVMIKKDNLGNEISTNYGNIIYKKDYSTTNFFTPKTKDNWMIVKDSSKINGAVSWCQLGVK